MIRKIGLSFGFMLASVVAVTIITTHKAAADWCNVIGSPSNGGTARSDCLSGQNNANFTNLSSLSGSSLTSQFISDVNADASSQYPVNQVGAAYIESRLQAQGGNWQDNIKAATLQIGNIPSSYACDNTAYDPSSNSVVKDTADCEYDTALLVYSGGKLVFILRLQCGNPIGSLSGPPPPPPNNHPATGTLSCSVSGSTYTFKYTFSDPDGTSSDQTAGFLVNGAYGNDSDAGYSHALSKTFGNTGGSGSYSSNGWPPPSGHDVWLKVYDVSPAGKSSDIGWINAGSVSPSDCGGGGGSTGSVSITCSYISGTSATKSGETIAGIAIHQLYNGPSNYYRYPSSGYISVDSGNSFSVAMSDVTNSTGASVQNTAYTFEVYTVFNNDKVPVLLGSQSVGPCQSGGGGGCTGSSCGCNPAVSNCGSCTPPTQSDGQGDCECPEDAIAQGGQIPNCCPTNADPSSQWPNCQCPPGTTGTIPGPCTKNGGGGQYDLTGDFAITCKDDHTLHVTIKWIHSDSQSVADVWAEFSLYGDSNPANNNDYPLNYSLPYNDTKGTDIPVTPPVGSGEYIDMIAWHYDGNDNDTQIQDLGIHGNLSTYLAPCATGPSSNPFFSVIGGDVAAGPGYTALTDAGNPNAQIKAENADTTGTGNPSFYGSGTQLAALAANLITSFATGVTNNGKASAFGGAIDPYALAFANTNPPISQPSTTYGGKFGQMSPVPDYYKDALGSGKPPLPSTNIGSLASGMYDAGSGPLTLSGGTLNAGTRVTILVTGNVYITGDITYGSYSQISEIPRFELIVKGGSINIAPTVHNLSGFYVAEPSSSGTGGTISTCAQSDGTPITNATPPPSGCGSQLTIYGATSSATLKLERTYGQTGDTSTGPAEQFVFSPELWITGLGIGLSSGSWQSITSLPPIL